MPKKSKKVNKQNDVKNNCSVVEKNQNKVPVVNTPVDVTIGRKHSELCKEPIISTFKRCRRRPAINIGLQFKMG